MGLHHVCCRVRAREDPDGIRLEVNFVPGQGHLEPGKNLPMTTLPGYDDYPE